MRDSNLDKINPNAPVGTLPWANSITLSAFSSSSIINMQGKRLVEAIERAECWRVMKYDSHSDWLEDCLGITPDTHSELIDAAKSPKATRLVELISKLPSIISAENSYRRSEEGSLDWAVSQTLSVLYDLNAVKESVVQTVHYIDKAEDGEAWRAKGYDSFKSWLAEEIKLTPNVLEKYRTTASVISAVDYVEEPEQTEDFDSSDNILRDLCRPTWPSSELQTLARCYVKVERSDPRLAIARLYQRVKQDQKLLDQIVRDGCRRLILSAER